MSKNGTEILPHNINKDLINYKFEYERQNYKTCRMCMKLFYNIKNFSSSKAKA